jgi:hypothetical protein
MLWGKHYWYTFHITALGFPEELTSEIRASYRQFYNNFGKILPCQKCRGNYQRHLEELPVDSYLFDRNSLFAWTVMFHNVVNKELGKDKHWSVDEAKEFYKSGKYSVKSDSKNMDTALMMTIFLLIVVIIFMIVRTHAR